MRKKPENIYVGVCTDTRGGAGEGVAACAIDFADDAGKLQSKTFTAHNAYYVKFIIKRYQRLNLFAIPMIVLLTCSLLDLPRLLLTGI